MSHISVLAKEVIQGLEIKEGLTFLDATLGSAGHSRLICEAAKGKAKIIGIDQDKDRIANSKESFGENKCQFEAVEGNFRDLDKILDTLQIKKVDRILYDLGLNSEQLENSGRGFSFKKNEPLLMNFSDNPKFTAREIVNDWEEESLRDILEGYGEERFSKSIAKKIIESREKKKIETTNDLVTIVGSAVPTWYRHRKIHFATKTFQALRITVNDELEALKESLAKGFERLGGGGRIMVISFHSLEDRIVKNFFKKLKIEGLGEIVTKKPVVPKIEEIRENPRSRSAKLRIIQKK